MPKIIKTKTKKEYNPIVSYMLSSVKGLFVSFAGLLCVSYFVMNNAKIGVITMIIAYVSIALGAFISGISAYRYLKNKGIFNGCVGGAVYCVIVLFIISVIMKFNISFNILIIIPVAVGFGAVGGILSANN